MATRSDGSGGRPTVLILTEADLELFDQFAASLKRRGVRVMRIYAGARHASGEPGRRPRTQWMRDRLLYDGRIPLTAWDSAARSLASAVDVMFNEETVAVVGPGDPRIRGLAERALAFSRMAPVHLLDKFEVNARLQRCGVRVPAQLSASGITPAAAVARLGLPLVIKGRVGLGGRRVRLAGDVEAVQTALLDLGGREAFYQQHVDGEMVMYATVCGEAGPLIEHGVKVIARHGTLGPSTRVKVFDDPILFSEGRAAMRALGCRGLAELCFVRDTEGRYWHIDANCRAWHSMVSLLAVGIDFVEPYMALITGRSYTPPTAPESGALETGVMPFALYEALAIGSRREIVRHLGQFAAVCREGPGLRYAGVTLLRGAALLLRRGMSSLAWRRSKVR